MADKKITSDQILDQYIPQYESMGGQNIPNYRFDPEHTAQGPYQLTVTNWNNYGPGVGIDLDKYPTPMDAPRPEQRKVAEYLLNYTPQGVRNWTDFNPKLKAALDKAGYEMPQDQEQDQDIDYSKKSPEELMKIIKARHPDMVIEPPKPAAPATTKKLDVKPPEKGFLQDWSTTPSMLDIMFPGRQNVKQMVRGFGGYGQPEGDEQTQSRLADVWEGGMGELSAASTPAILTGIGSLPALGKTLLKLAIGESLRAGGGKVAEDITKGSGGGQQSQRLAKDIVGDILGIGGYKYGLDPRAQAAALITGGAAFGHPYVGSELAALRLGLPTKLSGGRGLIGNLLDNLIRGGQAAPQPTPKAAPTSKVSSPGMKVTMSELNQMHENGLPDDRYVAIRNGATPTDAEILANRRAEIAKKAQKEAPPPPQSSVQVTPKTPPVAMPDPALKDPNQLVLPGSQALQPPRPPTNVQIPPDVQVQPTNPNQGELNLQPQGPSQLNLPVDAPPQQPSLPGTDILQSGRIQGQPLGGVKQSELPFPQSQGPQPLQPNLFGPVADPRQGSLWDQPPSVPKPYSGFNLPPQAPVAAPPGSAPAIQRVLPFGPEPRPSLPEQITPKAKPISESPLQATGKNVDTNAGLIRDAARTQNLTLPKRAPKTNWGLRSFQEKFKLNFRPRTEDIERAMEMEKSQTRANQKTPNNPGKTPD